MNGVKPRSELRACLRKAGATLFGVAIGFAITASAMAADPVTLRVGDQKGGNRSLLEIAGLAKDLPYKIEWSEFPAAAPILEALNAGALDVGYTDDLAFLTVYAAGAPIKAIGGTRADARTQAILVRQDSPIKTAADLKGKRLAGTRGGWGQFLIDATLEKAGHKIDDATFAPLGPVDAKIALVAGSIDGWAVWEPYVSYATLKDNARIIADGEGLTPTITFLVASDQPDRHRRRHYQGSSGGLRPCHPIWHPCQDARCKQGGGSQFYRGIGRIELTRLVPGQRQRAGIRCRPSLLRFNSCETPGCAIQCSRAAAHRAVWSDR